MDIKIFSVGFAEADFNTFCAKNIIYKTQILNDGTAVVFYKSPDKVGNNAIEDLEQLDRLTKQAQNEALAEELNLKGEEEKLANLKEKIAGLRTNDKEWDMVTARINECERQILMSKDTIAERTAQVGVFKDAARELTKKL